MTMSEIIIPGGSTHSAEGVGDRDPEEVGQEAHHEPDCIPTLAVPAQYFVYMGPAEAKGNSLYRCVKCPHKIISCNDLSRQNLKKHIMVSLGSHYTLI